MPSDALHSPGLFAIVLAAGAAERFGSTKQLAQYRGETLVRHAVGLAQQVCGPRSVLVCGADWQRVFSSCGHLAGFMVRNERYRDGMSSSIAAGVRAVAGAAEAVMLLLTDQPLITGEHLRDLQRHWCRNPDTIVATGYSDITGPPVIFPAAFFSELTTLEGDAGARKLLQANRERVRRIAFEPAAVDIDRPADLDLLD